jgi:hypothetical protein
VALALRCSVRVPHTLVCTINAIARIAPTVPEKVNLEDAAPGSAVWESPVVT